MSLPVTNLDDRSFQQLVDQAKGLIPKYCPEWTNHNVADPGVALIELFAWMTEMTLYRLNQVPDNFYTHMLNLLGFEPFPARAARANITFWTTETEATVLIPAGTEVASSADVGDPRVFTTLDEAVIRQPVLMAALTSEVSATHEDHDHDGERETYRDVWKDLKHGKDEIACFPRRHPTENREAMLTDDCFYLGFEESLANHAIRLTIEAQTQGIGVIPSHAPLQWEIWNGSKWVEASIPNVSRHHQLGDETGGLNRDGNILLMIPHEHRPLILGGVRAYWLRARLVETPDVTNRYKSSPRVRRVTPAAVGGTVKAEHSRRIDGEDIGVSVGRPDQVFQTEHAPVLRRPRGHRIAVHADGKVESWEEVSDFVESGPTSKHFVFDIATGTIRFGPRIRAADGTPSQHGAIPAKGARLRLVEYRTGGGAVGNVGSGTLTLPHSSIPFVYAVENLAPATGGVDPESVEEAKRRGPQTIRAGDRAVTVSDYERLAQDADRRVRRVRCVPPQRVGDKVRLLIVPEIDRPPEMLGIDDFVLPPDLVENVRNYIEPRRMIGTQFQVDVPEYQGVTIAAKVTATPGSESSDVRTRAVRALYRFVNPLDSRTTVTTPANEVTPDGFREERPRSTGWNFDTDLTATVIHELLESVEGVADVERVLFFDYDLRNHERSGRGKEVVKLEENHLFLSANHQVVVR